MQEQTEKTIKLTERMKGINHWIKENPQEKAPNAYEITECNLEVAEVLSAYKKETDCQNLAEAMSKYPEVKKCYFALAEMESLRDLANHPFFQQPEILALRSAIRKSQVLMTYDTPRDEEMRNIKKELIKYSIKVPFYIWQTQQQNPNYQYDNASEFKHIGFMLDLYKEEGNTQFVPEIEAAVSTIEKNYKFKSSPKTAKHV